MVTTTYPWLMLGDCLKNMSQIPDGSVDMVLCDLPYGTTACKWDVVIPFEPLWEQYWRVLKPVAACVLFATQPFTSALVMSAPSKFRYSWVWIKNNVTGFPNAKFRPLKKHEDILVFSNKGLARPNAKDRTMPYNPQGLLRCEKIIKNSSKERATWENRPCRKDVSEYKQEFTNYPKDVLEFAGDKGFHPTQKPVALLEYLINTYTKEDDIVLDNTMGSGSTGVACVNTKRKFIGIERDEKYYEVALNRIRASL